LGDKKIEDIKKEIKLLKKDLDQLQSGCLHAEDDVKFDIESNAIKKICKKCEKVIGYPTDQELKDNGFI
tara:strand:- start:322 stop:528 length:207 start_codon:yes stop_codon:yes gene_type:complete